MAAGSVGVLQGTMSYVLQDANGQIATTHSISAGLDYSAIGPEHAYLHDSGRAEYTSGQVTPRRSKDFSFAQNWKESFPL